MGGYNTPDTMVEKGA